MRKLLTMSLIACSSSGCFHFPREESVNYDPHFRIVEVQGEKLICQKPEDIKDLYEKLALANSKRCLDE